MSARALSSGAADSRRAIRAAVLLGFALGGFFDGILLHQILQWHHLLSAVDAPGLADLRNQVLADGAFHALMYVLAVTGLVLLLRVGAAIDARRFLAAAAIGFGAWHVLDTFVSHWWLGIHRVRMDVPNPLAWDLLWLVAFGLVPIALGVLLARRTRTDAGTDGDRGAGTGPGRDARAGRRAGTALALAVLVAGPWAALPPPDGGPLLVVFPGHAGPDAAMAAIAANGAGLLWFDADAGLWVVDGSADAPASAWYRHGALYAGRAAIALGCWSWLRGA